MIRVKNLQQFIQRATEVHKGKYTYGRSVYVNSRTKLIITCPVHGDFKQIANNHLRGRGCPKCGKEVGREKLSFTKEEFISRSKLIHGDRYDYSKVEYRNTNTKVTLTCKKHDIKFEQFPISHLRGCICCPKCIKEVRGRYEKYYWTYERCYKVAKEYEWSSEFKNRDEACYSACVRNGYLKDFTWLKRCYDHNENITIAKKHSIYRYEFPKYNTVYIGLTVELNKRHKRGHCKKGTVYNFCKVNNIEVPKPQIIEGNLTIDEAKNREDYWIQHYRKRGYKLLNKAKAGSVGTLYKVKTGKETEIFIEKAIRIHGDKYGYSKVEYKNNQTKVIITCPIHGDFVQTPSIHLKGCGCPKCSVSYRSNTEEYVVKARAVHGDKYTYSNVVYTDAKTKVTITCPIHGDFEQNPNNHLQGQGCPKCKNEKLSDRYRGAKDEFIIKAKKVHGEKYCYSKVKYVNCDVKVIITCPTHGEFEQTPSNHLQGQGCPKCSIEEHGNRLRKTLEEFITKSREVHGDKYDYSKVIYKNNRTKVIILCSIHGDFQQTPANHLHGQNCPKCSGVQKSSTEEFIVKAKVVHGNKFDYSEVEYKNDKTKVAIICPLHGEFRQTPHNHLQGQGCPKCGKERRVKLKTKWTYETCKTEAMKYRSRNEFRKGSCGAYEASRINGWLDEFYPKK